MNRVSKSFNLNVSYLLNGYRQNTFTPTIITQNIIKTLESKQNDNTFIYKLPSSSIINRAEELEEIYKSTDAPSANFFNQYPLYGIPFAVKDNIDVINLPTTCACPGYEYIATETAECVQTALDKGGILIGKTNLDQFATGLNGTRTAYGTPTNSINPDLIPGGSSSGSAVAVADEIVSFSFGTDTAGSGRVPACMNGIYGIKPSKDIISTKGVVPACKSLDCTSIFTRNIRDAFIVLDAVKCDKPELYHSIPNTKKTFKYGIPKRILAGDNMGMYKYFCGDREYFMQYLELVEGLMENGYECVEIDFEPFFEVARLLYEGPWVTERLCAIPFMSDDKVCNGMEGLNETVRKIISGASGISAKNCFDSFYKLEEITKMVQREIWDGLGLDSSVRNNMI